MRFPHCSPDPFPRPKDLHRDLPSIPPAEAERAIEALRRMTTIAIASVYTSAGSNHTRWQVWLDITRRHLTLAEWADEWLLNHPSPAISEQSREGA